MSGIFVRNCGAIVVGLFLGTSSALGGYTFVAPPTAPEKSIQEILDQLYGGSFLASGFDYSNGSVVADRILDTPDSLSRTEGVLRPLNLLTGVSGALARTVTEDLTTDQLWTSDSVEAVARARFATFSEEFGYFLGSSGDSFHKLFHTSGEDFNVGGSAQLDLLNGNVWRWARDGEGGPYTSQNSDNGGGLDHMITYQIFDELQPEQSGPDSATYLLFFEDAPFVAADTIDFDYNDLVVEIQVRRLAAVPEPASMGTLVLAGLASLRGIGRRRKV